jgi:hypothetical protein
MNLGWSLVVSFLPKINELKSPKVPPNKNILMPNPASVTKILQKIIELN